MKKKTTTALARTTKRTVTKPARETSIVPFQKGPDGALLLSEELKFQGASQLVLSEKESKALRAEFPAEAYDILPSGECYVSHVHVRRRLNDALGIGQWALVPVSNPIVNGGTVVSNHYLYVRGHFVRAVYGEAEYVESNKRMSYATALEAAYSNAVTRACKELGIASECWDKRWTEQWKRANAVRVWVEKKRDGEKKLEVAFRRKDADPLPYEKGFVKQREGEEAPEERGRPASSSVDTSLINGEQIDALVSLARARGVTPAALEKIVGSETGQTQFDRIQAGQYKTILTLVSKINAPKGR